MQTLYGVKCTDRIRVETFSSTLNPGTSLFKVYIDNVHVTTELTGRLAVHAAERCLREQVAEREADAARENEDADDKQRLADRCFIDELAYDLKIDSSRIEDLIDLIVRRSKEQ